MPLASADVYPAQEAVNAVGCAAGFALQPRVRGGSASVGTHLNALDCSSNGVACDAAPVAGWALLVLVRRLLESWFIAGWVCRRSWYDWPLGGLSSMLRQSITWLLCLGLAVVCTACGGGGSGSEDDGPVVGGFDDPTIKRVADGRYALGSSTFSLSYFRYDGSSQYKEYSIKLAAATDLDVSGRSLSGTSTVVEIANVTDGIVHTSGGQGVLEGYVVGESVAIRGNLAGYVWQLNFDFALGEDMQAHLVPYDGNATINAGTGLLTAGSLTGMCWRNGDADQVGVTVGTIPFSRTGNNLGASSLVGVPLPTASGDWYADGTWTGPLYAYLPSMTLAGNPVWGGAYDEIEFDLDLTVSAGAISGTATFVVLTENGESGAVDGIFTADEEHTVSGSIQGGLMVFTVAALDDSWSMQVAVAPRDVLANSGAEIEDVDLRYGVAIPDATWPPGECEVTITAVPAVTKPLKDKRGQDEVFRYAAVIK